MIKNLAFGVAGIVIGVLIASVSFNNNQSVPSPTPAITHDSTSMQGMVHELHGKSGDAFDKEFIRLMIEHHQGAIDMANLAQNQAQHREIKDLSQDIISAQEGEIELMQEWEEKWGY